MIIDIHTHSMPWSEDSTMSPDQLIRRAKEVGLDGICLTEHDWFRSREEVERLGREHDFLVLPGVELNTEEGHFLVFGLDKYVFGMHRASFTRRLVEEVGGVMILAHPYRRHFTSATDEDDYFPAVERACANPAFLLADAVEVLNGRSTQSQNAFSRDVQRRLNLRAAGGSDAHSLSDLGTCATAFERPIRNPQEFLAEVKAGRFRAADLRNGQLL